MYIKGMSTRNNKSTPNNTTYRHTNSREVREGKKPAKGSDSGQYKVPKGVEIEIERLATQASDAYAKGAAKLPINSQQPREIVRYVFAAAEKQGMTISEYVVKTMLKDACALFGVEVPTLDAYDRRDASKHTEALAQKFGMNVKDVAKFQDMLTTLPAEALGELLNATDRTRQGR